ncbi:unnamed protein product [Candidula unifasciata]|uniref:C3H1-type domain-containing protein n=1 Tax=Candidula unifasciata TaxID=100452 RepID=A0A8S3ZP22_9EUPU|nr:unnamed protein product [Candidula unifasciata]
MDDHGVDGEIEEVWEDPATDKSQREKDLSSKRGVALNSDRQHPQNNSHQRSSGHYLSNLDKRNNNRHSKKHRQKEVGSNITKNSSRGRNHSHRSTQQHSRQNAHNSTEDEDPLSKSPNVTEKNGVDSRGKPVRWPEKGETEDGEILEDGELDDDKEAPESQQMSADTDHMEASASKLNKGGKNERKRNRRRGKRHHENDIKKKNYAEVADFQDGKNQGPSWGSGYNMSNQREPGYKRGGKGYHSPLGLYDSPTEDLDNELVSQTLLTGGYLDASVAADEKQGLFNHKLSIGKPSKRKYEKKEGKRGRNADSSFEGPPQKKSLLDMQMSERPACKFYLEGKCAKGGMCPFNHDVEKPKKMEVCKYHLTFKGCVRQTCQFMHHILFYYHTGGKCFAGDRCKFSHDPLTEATRKALELRVAAEDIINMEDPSSNSEQRLREANKSSLLGSPPQLRPELKKIPSLLDIEVHMPGQSPKASPQIVRPSGFYNDTTESSGPGPINSVGLMKNVIASSLHSQLLNKSGGGAGLLPLPVRPGFMGSQPGLNPQHQRFGLGASVPMKTTQPPQTGHISPVLNMLGAIIREAATQKGPDSQSSLMPKVSMGVSGMSPSLNNGDHNKMAVQSIASNTNNFGSVNTGFDKAANSIASYGKMGSIENFSQDKDIKSNVKLNQIVSSSKTASSGQRNMLEESCKTEAGDTSQRNFDDAEESQDICELNKIRQQIQAQIDEEEQKEVAEGECEEQKIQLQEKPPADIQETEGLSTCNTVLVKKENVEIPTHLPKTQQELFKRIQQQQLLRETELDKQKTCITAEESKAKDVDDWYSSDEDEEGETKPKLTDVLKKLNQDPSSHASGPSAVETHITNPPEQKTVPSAASTFNIMQMINAIKVQSQLSKPEIENTQTTFQPLNLPQDSLQGPDSVMSPASPTTTVPTTIMKSFGILHNVSNCQPPPLAVDPPVISAVPLKPLNYVAVRISLEMPKPYAELLDSVFAADPAFKDDPRVKWHLSYIEKQPPKEPQSESSSEERSHKPSDPRLTKQSDSNGNDRIEGARTSDPRLHRTEPQSLPADPRLARLAGGNFDPRLNRQIIQNQNGSDILNIRGGAMPANIMNMDNPVGSFMNGPVNNVAPVQNMNGGMPGHIIGQIGGHVNSFNVEGRRMVQGGSGSPNMTESVVNQMNVMGRPMNQMVGEINQMHLLRAPHMPSFGLGGNRMMISQENTLEDPLCQPNQLRTDPSLIVSGVHNSSDPRCGYKVLNEMHGNTDPRLRHRSIGPIDQQQRFMNPRDQQQRFMGPRDQQQRFMGPRYQQQRSMDPRDPQQRSMDPRDPQQRSMDPRDLQQRSMDPRDQQQRYIDPRDPQQRSMDPRDQQKRSMDPRDQHFNMKDSGLFRMSPNSDTVSSTIQGSVNQGTLMHTNNFKPFTHGLQQQREISQSLNVVQKAQGDGLLPYPSSVASSMPNSDTDDSSLTKLDHRRDPRFKRVKKVSGPQKDSMEYSSPLGDDKCVDVPGGNGQYGSAHNSYNRSRSSHDTGVRAVPSPPLPDTLRDFSLPASPSLNVAEPFVQVKHLFKTIDPTASPFC